MRPGRGSCAARFLSVLRSGYSYGEPTQLSLGYSLRGHPGYPRAVVEEEPASGDLALDCARVRVVARPGYGGSLGSGLSHRTGARRRLPAQTSGGHGRRGGGSGPDRTGPLRPDAAQDPWPPTQRGFLVGPTDLPRLVAVRDGVAGEQPGRHPRVRAAGANRRLRARDGG